MISVLSLLADFRAVSTRSIMAVSLVGSCGRNAKSESSFLMCFHMSCIQSPAPARVALLPVGMASSSVALSLFRLRCIGGPGSGSCAG